MLISQLTKSVVLIFVTSYMRVVIVYFYIAFDSMICKINMIISKVMRVDPSS